MRSPFFFRELKLRGRRKPTAAISLANVKIAIAELARGRLPRFDENKKFSDKRMRKIVGQNTTQIKNRSYTGLVM
jgi:hypothetical protein